MDEKTIFLATVFNADGTETERLVRATTAHAGRAHCLHICKANAQNVADVLGKGGKIEDASN